MTEPLKRAQAVVSYGDLEAAMDLDEGVHIVAVVDSPTSRHVSAVLVGAGEEAPDTDAPFIRWKKAPSEQG